MVDEPVDSWNILWDEKYTDSILMQDSVRDAFAVALKSLGYSLNSTDLDELEAAKKLLIKQKPLVQAYVIDQVRDKMIGNEVALGVIYSGEALYCQKENPDLEYVIPKEDRTCGLTLSSFRKCTKQRTQRRLSTTSAVLILQK